MKKHTITLYYERSHGQVVIFAYRVCPSGGERMKVTETRYLKQDTYLLIEGVRDV